MTISWPTQTRRSSRVWPYLTMKVRGVSMKKQKIVIPLDETPFSRQIIASVCRLYQPNAVTILLLHVAPKPDGLLASPPRAVTEAWPTPLYQSERDAELAQHPIYPMQAESSERSQLIEELEPETRALQAEGFDVMVSVQFGDPVAT